MKRLQMSNVNGPNKRVQLHTCCIQIEHMTRISPLTHTRHTIHTIMSPLQTTQTHCFVLRCIVNCVCVIVFQMCWERKQTLFEFSVVNVLCVLIGSCGKQWFVTQLHTHPVQQYATHLHGKRNDLGTTDVSQQQNTCLDECVVYYAVVRVQWCIIINIVFKHYSI